MQSRAFSGRPVAALLLHGAVALTMLASAAHGASAAPPAGSARPAYYSCYAGSRVLKSDQEFADCQGVQTRTIGGIEERILTPEQAGRQEKCERDKSDAMAEWLKVDRSNRNLLSKYPDIASLRATREADLASARESVARSQARLVDLGKDHDKLLLELEFYRTGNVPQKLQRSVDDNSAVIAAQEQVLVKSREDVARIGANFDALEVKMRELWVGKGNAKPSIDCSTEKLFGPIPRR